MQILLLEIIVLPGFGVILKWSTKGLRKAST